MYRNKAFLALGSNIGNWKVNFNSCLRELQNIGELKSIGNIYISKPYGYKDQNDFYNTAVEIQMDPKNSRILYASTWNLKRTPYSLISGGPGSLLWKSTDSGVTWSKISDNKGFAKGKLGIIGVTVSPVNPERVFAIVEITPSSKVYIFLLIYSSGSNVASNGYPFSLKNCTTRLAFVSAISRERPP